MIFWHSDFTPKFNRFLPTKLLSSSPSFFFAVTSLISATSAGDDSIHGCSGFVEASSSLIKARKSSDTKLDYSHITVKLRTVDGLLKDSNHCAPNCYYFIPVYDNVFALDPICFSFPVCYKAYCHGFRLVCLLDADK